MYAPRRQSNDRGPQVRRLSAQERGWLEQETRPHSLDAATVRRNEDHALPAATLTAASQTPTHGKIDVHAPTACRTSSDSTWTDASRSQCSCPRRTLLPYVLAFVYYTVL